MEVKLETTLEDGGSESSFGLQSLQSPAGILVSGFGEWQRRAGRKASGVALASQVF